MPSDPTQPMTRDTPTPTMFGCVSHSPLIAIRPKAPPHEAEIVAHCEAFRERVEAFCPDRILFFTNNHFAGFHYANMPAFCIGTNAHAVTSITLMPSSILISSSSGSSSRYLPF